MYIFMEEHQEDQEAGKGGLIAGHTATTNKIEFYY
jgi:hypothetical protein